MCPGSGSCKLDEFRQVGKIHDVSICIFNFIFCFPHPQHSTYLVKTQMVFIELNLSYKEILEDYVCSPFLFMYSIILDNGCISALKAKGYISKELFFNSGQIITMKLLKQKRLLLILKLDNWCQGQIFQQGVKSQGEDYKTLLD